MHPSPPKPAVITSFQCPVCGNDHAPFRPYGVRPRPEAQCPGCGSFERHRLAWLFFQRKTDLFRNRAFRFLHIAPERSLGPRLRQRLGDRYLSADLDGARAMTSMDITRIAYPQRSFEVIYCSHVLEHVPADKKAMAEFYRVLSPGGWALFQVPIHNRPTYEDFSIVTREGRESAFGQWDHVRIYGMDFADRLRSVGFSVRHLVSADIVPASEVQRFRLEGLQHHGRSGPGLFLCGRRL